MSLQSESVRHTARWVNLDTFVAPKRILVATDFSPTADRALEFSLSFARSYQSTIYLAHIIPTDPFIAPEFVASTRAGLREAAQEGMKKALRLDRMFGVPHESIIEEGPVWQTIETLIQRHEINIVMVGTKGLGSMEKVLVGSTAEEIFRRAEVPVLTVGPGITREPLYGLEFKNILFATDFGPSAEYQAKFAFSLAQQHRSRLTLLHAVPNKSGGIGSELEPEIAIERLRDLIPVETELHCLPLFRVPTGHAVEEIVRAANETRADLIILGAKSRAGLAGHVPHTKAYQVVRQAPCPVLTIKS